LKLAKCNAPEPPIGDGGPTKHQRPIGAGANLTMDGNRSGPRTAVNPGCRNADRTATRRSDARVEIIAAPALTVPGTPVPPLDWTD